MLPAIQFDDQILLQGNKINDVPAYRVLSPKSESLQLSAPHERPQFSLGIGGLFAQLSSKTF